jgi:hypothetical protein
VVFPTVSPASYVTPLLARVGEVVAIARRFGIVFASEIVAIWKGGEAFC